MKVDKGLEFPRSKLTLGETLGEGQFGRVVAGKAVDIGAAKGAYLLKVISSVIQVLNTGITEVAVKMMKSICSHSELSDLLSEYELLSEVDHPNVIKVLFHSVGFQIKKN